jgi:hypothetical protein
MERLGYQRLGAFLADYQDGTELAHAIAYLHRDDEVQMERLTYAVTKAIVQAFGGGKQQPEEKEPVFDTTDPEFTRNFLGFI